jgi:Fe-S-cluster containining protein
MAHGLGYLRFRCTECGECCRRFRVPVTGADLTRLERATGKTSHEFVAWLAPTAVDMTGEPDNFVRLPEGRRLLVLRQTEAGCEFLSSNRCQVHAERPISCRVYPFDVKYGARHGIKRLKMLDMEGCEAAWDAKVDPHQVVREKLQEQRELAEYTLLVARFNRIQGHRQRFGKRLLDASVFVASLRATERGDDPDPGG